VILWNSATAYAHVFESTDRGGAAWGVGHVGPQLDGSGGGANTHYRCLLIPERLHRGLLEAATKAIVDLLAAGGTVVTFRGGEPLPEFLPGVVWEHRPTNYWWWREPGADLGLISPSRDHPLLGHIRLADATWHYHGVLDPPAGADSLVALPTGEALLYVDEVSTPGTLVVATLTPSRTTAATSCPPPSDSWTGSYRGWPPTRSAERARSEPGADPPSSRQDRVK
jgi:hypothetical protein